MWFLIAFCWDAYGLRLSKVDVVRWCLWQHDREVADEQPCFAHRAVEPVLKPSLPSENASE